MSHIFIHMERARVHGLECEAKLIPRGITGNGYDEWKRGGSGGGGNRCVIKQASCKDRASTLIKEYLDGTSEQVAPQRREYCLMNTIFHQTHHENVNTD